MIIAAVTLWLLVLRAIGLIGPSPMDLRDAENDRSLPLRDVLAINKAYWDNFVFHKWQKGDIVVLNNDLCSHGRVPYTGKRTVLTAFGWGCSLAPAFLFVPPLDSRSKKPHMELSCIYV